MVCLSKQSNYVRKAPVFFLCCLQHSHKFTEPVPVSLHTNTCVSGIINNAWCLAGCFTLPTVCVVNRVSVARGGTGRTSTKSRVPTTLTLSCHTYIRTHAWQMHTHTYTRGHTPLFGGREKRFRKSQLVPYSAFSWPTNSQYYVGSQ